MVSEEDEVKHCLEKRSTTNSTKERPPVIFRVSAPDSFQSSKRRGRFFGKVANYSRRLAFETFPATGFPSSSSTTLEE